MCLYLFVFVLFGYFLDPFAPLFVIKLFQDLFVLVGIFFYILFLI
jgi:hypothetical protein